MQRFKDGFPDPFILGINKDMVLFPVFAELIRCEYKINRECCDLLFGM